MQRYHSAGCSSAVNNSAIGVVSARDSARADSTSLPANFSVNPRRPSPVIPYKLKSDKEPLNSRFSYFNCGLGPPDFNPPTPNCPEETLTKEYLQSGCRETVERLETVKMSTTEAPKKHSVSNIVKLDIALKLAEKWVNHMTKAAEDDPTEEEESRPNRLGLGAKVPRQSRYVPSDPLDRKLYAKLDSHARSKARSAEESTSAARVECGNDDVDDDDDENLDSRSNAFAKKRAAPQLTPYMQARKRK